MLILKKLKSLFCDKQYGILRFLIRHKIYTAAAVLVTVMCIVSAAAVLSSINGKRTSSATDSSAPEKETVVSQTETSSEDLTSEESPPAESSQSQNTSFSVKQQPAVLPAISAPASGGNYKYNTNSDIDDNVFLDALIYTGYNIQKHRADGRMWQYILASNKRGLGYLSNITYSGGSSGYETSNGKPDIAYFEKHGLVCASYATYVYFNYLPNAAGIDTSMLARPQRSTSANDWYTAAKQWISSGYSKSVSFTASKSSSGFINFKLSEDIPIGSIIAFCDARNKSDYCSHIVIYAGYRNGYHWVFHVGNSNGPEFCAVERMHFGHDPQWPIAVITTPSNIRMSALLEISVTDTDAVPVSGVRFALNSGSSVTDLGETNDSGIITKEGLSYGEYTVSITAPEGYTIDGTAPVIKLTTANNSKNTLDIKLTKLPQDINEPETEDTPSVESLQQQQPNF